MILQRDKHSFCDNCVCTYGNDKDCMYCEYYIVSQEEAMDKRRESND